jgi:SAM-dependent methyltransferase
MRWPGGEADWERLPEAFSQSAPRYDERFCALGQVQRARQRLLERLIRGLEPGSWILDLAAGTGEDARWLLERGFRVHAVDAAPGMLEVLRKKTAFWASAVRIEKADIRRFQPEPQHYAAALLNFGGLNAVPDPRPVMEAIARGLRPGGRLLLVVINRWAVLDELLCGLRQGRLRRWKDPIGEALVDGQSIPVRYYGLRELRRLCRDWIWEGAEALWLLLPPPGYRFWTRLSDRLRGLEAVDAFLSRLPLLRALGDHLVLWLRRPTNGQGGCIGAPGPYRPPGSPVSGLLPRM